LITITRSLARKFRSLLRRAGLGKQAGQSDAFVHMIADSTGLKLRTAGADIALEYHQPGDVVSAELLVVPVEALAIVEGRTDDAVTIESSGPNRVTIGWIDRGVPQMIDRAIPATLKDPTWPELPTTFKANPPELWTALRQGLASTDRLSSRYALGCLQLRGGKGEIAATDGQQILTQAGFEFPWPNDLLIPGSSLLGCKDLDPGEGVAVGQAGQWISLAIGHWVVSLKVSDGRFPRIDDCIPTVATLNSHLTLSPADAEFLAHALPSLPKQDEQHDPVTLDLNGRVIVRAKADGPTRATELILTNSRLEGDAIVMHSNRKFLARALELGFHQVHFNGAEAPVLCYDDRRRFLWAVLDHKSAIPRSDDAISIVSPVTSPSNGATSPTARRSIVSQKPAPATPVVDNTTRAAPKPQASNRVGAIEQATALRDSLRSATSAAHQLLRSLKQQKRQARIVESTLASLKQLQKVAC